MNGELKRIIQKLARNFEIPESDLTVILNYFQAENETLESITIKLGGDSTTRKFTNLRFRMGDLFQEGLESAATAPSQEDNVIKWAYFALRLIQKIRKLEVYPLTQQEARLLVQMFRLRLERNPITIENLLHLLGKEWNQDQLIAGLNNLERLGCISYGEAGVTLVEEIEIK